VQRKTTETLVAAFLFLVGVQGVVGRRADCEARGRQKEGVIGSIEKKYKKKSHEKKTQKILQSNNGPKGRRRGLGP